MMSPGDNLLNMNDKLMVFRVAEILVFCNYFLVHHAFNH